MSRDTCEWVVTDRVDSFIWMSHSYEWVIHMNESFIQLTHSYEWLIRVNDSLIWMSRDTYAKEPRRAWMPHVTYGCSVCVAVCSVHCSALQSIMFLSGSVHTHVNESRRVWTNEVAYVNDSCHSREWVTALIWMSHGPHMNESWHVWRWVTARMNAARHARMGSWRNRSHVSHKSNHIRVMCECVRSGVSVCVSLSREFVTSRISSRMSIRISCESLLQSYVTCECVASGVSVCLSRSLSLARARFLSLFVDESLQNRNKCESRV